MSIDPISSLRKRLALLLIEHDLNKSIELDLGEFNDGIDKLVSNKELNCCALIITDILFPCAANTQLFEFALDLMSKWFVSKEHAIDWSRGFVSERIARFLLKQLEESNDPVIDEKIENCYKKFTDRLIKDDLCKTESDVVEMYLNYCELLLKVATSTSLNENFASEFPEFCEPIIKDLGLLLDLHFYSSIDHLKSELLTSENVDGIAEKFIEMLKFKYEPAFIAHCIIPSIWSKILSHRLPACLTIETFFDRAQKLFELYYWPVIDAGRIENFGDAYLDALHEFELLIVFNDVLLSDFMANPKNDYNRDEILNFPNSLNPNLCTKQLLIFLLQKVQATICDWFGMKRDENAVDLVLKSENKAITKEFESIAELGTIFLHDFLNTISRFLELEIDPIDDELLEIIKRALNDLNTRLKNVIKAYFYLKLGNVEFESEFLDQLSEQFFDEYKDSDDSQLVTLSERKKHSDKLFWEQFHRYVEANDDEKGSMESEHTDNEEKATESKELDETKFEDIVGESSANNNRRIRSSFRGGKDKPHLRILDNQYNV